MKRLLLLAFTLATGIASAQNLPLWWSGFTGNGSAGDSATASAFDGSGNLYTLTSSAGLAKVTKFSNTGAVLWTNSTSGLCYGLTVDPAGNAIVTGTSLNATSLYDLLLARFAAGDGAAAIRTVDNAFGTNDLFLGYTSVIDPADGNIALVGIMSQGNDPRPYVLKFDGVTLAEIWRTGIDDIAAGFSHIVASGNRLYVGGSILYNSSIVGYVPSEGGSLTTIVTTPDSAIFRNFTAMKVVNDRVIWGGATEYSFDSVQYYGEFYGQADFTAGSGNTFTEVTNVDSGTIINDIAYDAPTGRLAFQARGQGINEIRFATIDEATDGFVFGPTVSMLGQGIGLAPVTGGRFASYYEASPLAPNQIGVSLVDPALGVISGSFLGEGFVTTHPSGIPSVPVPPVASLGRATAINVGSAVGGRVYSLSYVAGPASDNRRFKEDTSYTFNVLHNDPGVGAKLSYIVSNPAHGTATLTLDGTAVYNPAPNWYGTDSFVYHLYVDGVFASAETVTYTVLNVNDAPVAVADNVGTVGTGLVTLSLLDNDVNVDGEASPLRYLSVTQPSNGTVTLANNKTALKIKAAPGQAGQPFSFTYTVQNGTGMTSTATVTGTF
ncbi:hypothetical protein EON81_11740 [bacterium]|nr:MAG: hypothetical protein EON81_11740 [bacterium]